MFAKEVVPSPFLLRPAPIKSALLDYGSDYEFAFMLVSSGLYWTELLFH